MAASRRFVFARSTDEDSGGAVLFLLRAPPLHHRAERSIWSERYRTVPGEDGRHGNAASLRNIRLTRTVMLTCQHAEERVSDRGGGFKETSHIRLVKHVVSVRCSLHHFKMSEYDEWLRFHYR